MTDSPSVLSPAELHDHVRELALSGGAVLMRWFRKLDEADIRFKGRRNPVTDADLASEECIIEGIQQRFPGHAILAEESGERPGEEELQWVIDPLDGTVNFSHGIAAFAVAIAVRRGAELLAGCIYSPALDEMFSAYQGGGATLNGNAIQVTSTSKLDQALLATGFCYERNEVADNNVGHFNDLILECRDIRRVGSAAVDFCWTACGRYDAFWELNLSPWDVAAGALLVQEAGGRVTDLDGGNDMVDRGEFLAAGPAMHETLLPLLQRGRSGTQSAD